MLFRADWRDLETLLQEMVATREETRALIALMTRVAEKIDAVVTQIAHPQRADDLTKH